MTTPTGLVCWNCGEALDDVLLPLSRREECPACRAELHVCRMCRYYDTRVAKACREPVAEEVHDKTRANFCGYLEPRPEAFTPSSPEATSARASLDALFGGPSVTVAAEQTAGDADRAAVEAARVARAELERLFGGGS